MNHGGPGCPPEHAYPCHLCAAPARYGVTIDQSRVDWYCPSCWTAKDTMERLRWIGNNAWHGGTPPDDYVVMLVHPDYNAQILAELKGDGRTAPAGKLIDGELVVW
jgi:hypothetical protein